MANPEHLAKLREGVEAWNAWREKNPGIRPDLSGSDLRAAGLSGVDLSDVDLRGAELREADLSDADLRKADLDRGNLYAADVSNARFREANLRGANLFAAKLLGADLFGADLCGAHLGRARLREANLAHARADHTAWGALDLSEATGLERIVHLGPSPGAFDTARESKGRIPVEFLRGCGLSPWEIVNARLYDPALTPFEISEIQNAAFQERAKGWFFGGVFISYSHDDSGFVDKIYKKLADEGASVWLDKHDMKAGSLQKQVANAIRLNDIVLIVLSESSIESDWVENELEMARRKEMEESRDVLCPVALDDSWNSKLELGTPSRQLWRRATQKDVLDFSKWKTKAFGPVFQKLLNGLKINYGPKA